MPRRAEVSIFNRLKEIDMVYVVDDSGRRYTTREYLTENPKKFPRSDIALVSIFDGDHIVDQKAVYATKNGLVTGSGVDWLSRSEVEIVTRIAHDLAEAAKVDPIADRYFWEGD